MIKKKINFHSKSIIDSKQLSNIMEPHPEDILLCGTNQSPIDIVEYDCTNINTIMSSKNLTHNFMTFNMALLGSGNINIG